MPHGRRTPAQAIRQLGGAALLVVALTACAAPSTTSSPPTTASTSTGASSTTGVVPSTRASDRAAASPPSGLELPGLDHPAPVTLAPVLDDGQLVVPDDVSELGWWIGSAPASAATGTTLLAGHVDSAERGLGVFARLRQLSPGDEVTVLDGLGGTERFRVSGAQEVLKGELPAELFDTSGPRRLALVTCAGAFDLTTRSYADNLIVWAEPR